MVKLAESSCARSYALAVRVVWMLGIAAAVAACTKNKNREVTEEPVAEARDTRALWRLAPAAAKTGVVVAPGTLATLHHGFMTAARGARMVPARVLDQLLAEVRRSGFDPSSPAGLGAIGVDARLGAAVFFAGEEPYAVLPVGDRAAFRKAFGGDEIEGVDRFADGSACAPSAGHYRCAQSPERLADWTSSPEPLDRDWPAHLRGSIEMRIDGAWLAEPLGRYLGAISGAWIGIQFERGAVDVRFSIAGAPRPKMRRSGATPLADAAKRSNPSALLILGFAEAALRTQRAGFKKADEPTPFGVTSGEVFDSLTGEIVAYTPAGERTRGYIDVGINDPATWRSLLEHCTSLAAINPAFAVEKTERGCRLTLPSLVDLEVEVGDGSLVMSAGDRAAGRAGDTQTLPQQLLDERWLAAVWVRGSAFGGAPGVIPIPNAELMLQAYPPVAIALWAFAHVSELGAGIRADDRGLHGFARVATTWRNPDDVVEALEPVAARFAAGDARSIDAVKALGRAHPDSILAADLALGAGGTVGATLAVLTATAVPAFLTYIKKSKAGEARRQLARLYDGVRVYHAKTGALPKASTALTPPAGSCCSRDGDECAPDPTLWTGTWAELSFSIDEPHSYHYQYVVAPDASELTVRAIGDLDCDGVYSTFEMYSRSPPVPAPTVFRENELE